MKQNQNEIDLGLMFPGQMAAQIKQKYDVCISEVALGEVGAYTDDNYTNEELLAPYAVSLGKKLGKKPKDGYVCVTLDGLEMRSLFRTVRYMCSDCYQNSNGMSWAEEQMEGADFPQGHIEDADDWRDCPCDLCKWAAGIQAAIDTEWRDMERLLKDGAFMDGLYDIPVEKDQYEKFIAGRKTGTIQTREERRKIEEFNKFKEGLNLKR